jgi:hypothetical protein
VKKEDLVEAQLVIAAVMAGYGVRTPRATRMAMYDNRVDEHLCR